MSGIERLFSVYYLDLDGGELDRVSMDEITFPSAETAVPGGFRGRWRFTYTWPEPGEYLVLINWEDGVWLPLDPELPLPEPDGRGGWYSTIRVTATDLPDRTYGMQGASDFDDGASNVRRSGRKTWTGVKVMPRAWAKRGDEARNDMAVAWASKMRDRVRGRERTRTINVVPAPWLMPGDVIHVDGSDGVQAADVTIDAVTIPLVPTEDGETIETTYRELAE